MGGGESWRPLGLAANNEGQSSMGRHSKKLSRRAAGGLGGRKPRPITLASCPWDIGPDTPSQRAGKRIEDATYTDPETGEKRNPNGVKRARRVDVAESLHRQGYVSRRGLAAALRIREAFERTMQTPPAIKKVQVDNSPKPDHAVAIIVDRISKFHAAARHIPRGYWNLVVWVVIDNRHPGSYPNVKKLKHLSPGKRHRVGCAAAARALDAVADSMGMA